MNLIPLYPSRTFRFAATLEGYLVRFRFRWNFIAAQWFVDVDCDEVGFHSHGFALVTDDNIVSGHAVPELGEIVLLDHQGEEDPDFDGLGVRWKLYYVTKAEVDAA